MKIKVNFVGGRFFVELVKQTVYTCTQVNYNHCYKNHFWLTKATWGIYRPALHIIQSDTLTVLHTEACKNAKKEHYIKLSTKLLSGGGLACDARAHMIQFLFINHKAYTPEI